MQWVDIHKCVCFPDIWVNQPTSRLTLPLNRRVLSTCSLSLSVSLFFLPLTHTHTHKHPALTRSPRAPPLSWRRVSTTVSSLYSAGWWMFGFSRTGSCSTETPLSFSLWNVWTAQSPLWPNQIFAAFSRRRPGSEKEMGWSKEGHYWAAAWF